MTTAPDDPIAAELRGSGIAETTNVLILAPTFAPGRRATCSTLLTGVSERPISVLAVTYRQPDKWLAVWRQTDDAPLETTIIAVGDGKTGGSTSESDTDWPVTVIHSTPDLTNLGIRLTEYVEDHTDEYEVRLCFDSISHMLQYADIKRVFRFLHVCIGRLNQAGVHAHFHLDPSAHDQQTVNLIKELFDAIVEIDEDGDITARAR